MTMLIPIRDDNPYKRVPAVTIGLIAINVVVFFALPPTQPTIFRYGAIPCDLLSRCPALSSRLQDTFPDRTPLLTVISSMFLHGGIAHLGGNMLYLWVFGNNVEDRLGHIRYLFFYLVCGVAAAYTHIFLSAGSGVPIVGASGAISGVLAAYFVTWPRARVLTLVPFLLFIPVEVSAGFLLGMWFVMQLLYGLGGLGMSQGSGVAFWAHVGGFVAGWLLVRVLGRRKDPTEAWFTAR